MALKITGVSHLDHGLSQQVWDFIIRVFGEKTSFFCETVTLPEGIESVPCGLYGPKCGDAPQRDVSIVRRKGRNWDCRRTAKPVRQSRLLTVIGGGTPTTEPGEVILYTAYGGPSAPREPGDPSMNAEEKAESELFWNEQGHALSFPDDVVMEQYLASVT